MRLYMTRRYTEVEMAATPFKSPRWPLRLLLLICFGFALGQTLHDPKFASSNGRGWAAIGLLLLALGSAVTIRRARWSYLNLGLLITSVLALQLLGPKDDLSIMLYVAVGALGAGTSARWLPYVAFATVFGVVLLASTQTRLSSTSDLLGVAFSFAATFFLAHTLVTLRRSRDELARVLKELQQAHGELRVYAAQAEELAVAKERNRLARDLHDTLGHALSAITVQLEAVRRVARHQPENLEPLIQETQSLSRQALRDLRESLSDLRRLEDELPLQDRVQRLAEQFAKENYWTLSLNLAVATMPAPQAHALVRVAQEALYNAARHAHAEHVTVELCADVQDVKLTVGDNGVGFDTVVVRPGHYGLEGVRERVSLLGGIVEVTSRPGHGTQVRVSIPLSVAEEPLRVEA